MRCLFSSVATFKCDRRSTVIAIAVTAGSRSASPRSAVSDRADSQSWNEWSFHDCWDSRSCSGEKPQVRMGGASGARTRSPRIKEDRCTAPSALAALISREYARKAHTAHQVRWRSSHDTFHEIRASSREVVH